MRAHKDENPGRADLGFQREALTKAIVPQSELTVNALSRIADDRQHEPVLFQAAKALVMFLTGAV
jgi:hypothetical protein